MLIDKESDVVLLFRHGAEHNTPPHKINYLANICALKTLGVERILALSSVGSLREDVVPGDFLVPNDFLEFTKARKSTFYDGDDGKVVHVDVTEPYCPELQKVTKEILKKRDYKFDEGVITSYSIHYTKLYEYFFESFQMVFNTNVWFFGSYNFV